MARKKKKIIDVWRQIRFKYKLILLNENTLEEVFSSRLSQLTAFTVALFISLLFIILVALVIVNTSLRTYLPGYLDMELRTEVVDLRLKLDSLSNENSKRELYLENIRSVLKGELKYDSIVPLDSVVTIPVDSLLQKSEREKTFCSRFEDDEKYNLTILNTSLPMEGMVFCSPVKGMVQQGFNYKEKHFGVSLLCAARSNVSSPLKGTVIFCGYTGDWEYVMQIQHSNDFVSVFKNIGTPMKEINQIVDGGSVIGVPAVTTDDERPVVYYELWHKGSPVNPEEYINF